MVICVFIRGQIYGQKGTNLWLTGDRFSVDNFFIHRLWVTFRSYVSPKENTREQQNHIAAKPLVSILGLCRSYYADLRSRREGAVLHARALRATAQR